MTKMMNCSVSHTILQIFFVGIMLVDFDPNKTEQPPPLTEAAAFYLMESPILLREKPINPFEPFLLGQPINEQGYQ